MSRRARGNPESERVITLISMIRRTGQLMVDEVTARLEAAGFPDSPPTFHPIFENLDPGGTRLTTLAARTGLTHQSVGEVIDVLVRRGYVERVADPSDRRARLVVLTNAGEDLVRAAVRVIAAIEREWTARWEAAGLRGDVRSALAAALPEGLERDD
jgi:DNA-binding MarR family transcriptional regulator